MKVKVFGIVLIICLMAILLPATVLGYENIEKVEENGITYQFFDNGTAKIISIKDIQGQRIYPSGVIPYNGEDYKVTSIGEKAFDELIQKSDLCLLYEQALELDSGISFDMINNIYIKQGAIGYTEEAGWSTGKVKTYNITTQPQDLIVTAGDISDMDMLTAVAEYPVGGGSIVYNWYSCDINGNITDDNPVCSGNKFKIPTDLSYDNENNISKDYYFVCVIGEAGKDVLEYTRVSTVTVNPGTYKVSFEAGNYAEWSAGEDVVVVPVNSERKITESDIPSVENLNPFGDGVSFVGWSTDGSNVVNPTDITFDKNTTLSPIWQFTIKFDANGGSFSNNKTTIEFLTTYDDFEIFDKILDIEDPNRDGHTFLGFYTEKTGGTRFESYIEDDGIFGSLTFYARWKENDINVAEPEVQPEEEVQPGDNNNNIDNTITDNTNNSNTTNGNNPQTGDNIIFFVGMLFISFLGVIVTSKYRKYNNK